MRLLPPKQFLIFLIVLSLLPTLPQAQSIQNFIKSFTSVGLVKSTPLVKTEINTSNQINLEAAQTGYRDDTTNKVIYGTGEFVTVKRGDTLSTIASDLLGNPQLWPEICALNKLEAQCSSIFVGQKLELPISYFKHQFKKEIQDSHQAQLENSIAKNALTEELLQKTTDELKSAQLKTKNQQKLQEVSQKKLRQKLSAAKKNIDDHVLKEIMLNKTVEDLKSQLKDAQKSHTLKEINLITSAYSRSKVQGSELKLITHDNRSVTVIVSDRHRTQLRDLDGYLIYDNQWGFHKAFLVNKEIFVIFTNHINQKKFGIFFDINGKFQRKTAILQDYEIEAITGVDLDSNGLLGATKTIEGSGKIELMVGPEAYYFARKNGKSVYLRDPRGDIRRSESNFKLLHAEPYKSGLLILYSYNKKLGTYRSNNLGEFQDWYSINSYKAFFDATSRE